MSSAICQNFVQNAWKKELCSNCFKSIDEHQEKPKPKPVHLISNDKVSGIIKSSKKAKTKYTVCFVKDLVEIIGYGGEDWWSDNEETSNGSNESSEEDTDDESAKELQRITKENTDYNTVSLKESDNKKNNNYAPLLLGKPVVDSSGKKQTLLVSVTPFGEDSSSHQVKKLNTKNFQISTSNKVILPPETETNVVLTSYTKSEQVQSQIRQEKSLLDEITETLENGRNPIQIIKKKTVENAEEKSEKKSTNLTRTPALKRDIEKPVIHQLSLAKVDSPNSNDKQTKCSPKLEHIQTTKNFINAEIQHSKSDFFPKEKFLKEKYIPFSQSRDLAGKPDGREDPVTNETPPLPKTPPPPVHLDAQSSFLHGAQPVPLYEKPKIPSKPVVMKKTPVVVKTASKPIEDANDSDSKCNKRKAPSPPEEIVSLSSTRSTPRSSTEEEAIYVSADPLPRKSLSTDCLTINDKRKDKNKARFSLKKFLKMGSHKDLSKVPQIEQEDPAHKPKLIIVHPCELNGTKVEVVSKQLIEDNQHEYSVPTECFQSQKAAKPPPPPRNTTHSDYNKPVLPTPPKSVEIINKQKQLSRNNSASKQQETVYANIGEVRSSIVPNKPVRTASMREREAALQLQLQHQHQHQQKQNIRKHAHNYEPLNNNNNNNNKDPNENVYDYINSTRSSSPDSDPGAEKAGAGTKNQRLAKRSESSQDVAGEYFKYGPIPRSVSLTYCGSETESEIYSPYGFYGSESEVTEDDHDWIQHGRTHKLRSRKGRSIVHKNLEDNYGAVVVANYEALAQVLENIQQINHIQPALRGLKTVSNMRWTDFSVKSSTSPVSVGSRVFHQAMWGTHNVTVAVSAGSTVSNAMPSASCTLTPIIEFSDLIPNGYLATNDNDDENNKQTLATAWIFPYLQINTIQSYGELLKTKSDEECWRDSNFTMLQLVNALKTLQAQGIEELPLSLSSFVLCKDMDKETHHRLCVFQGMTLDVASKAQQEKQGTLCMCASRALNCLQPSPKIASLLQSLLNHERAVSLTQVKSVLEFSLWGPSDVSLGVTIKERELALQRWLDLQRATVLHGLVCTRIQLTVYEEFHLLFLVRSSARMMCDASLLIESSNLKHSVGFGQSRAEKCVLAC